MDTGFYVGPVGSLVQLPDVASDVDVATARIGGSDASLMGNAWRDTLGYRRTWTWKWADLLPAQLPYIEALTHGLVPGPLRLVDPRRANRLPEQQASGGSRSRSPRGFAVTAGGLTYRALTRVEPDPRTLGPWQLLRGCIEWGRSAGGSGMMFPSDPGTGEPWLVPLLTSQERLQLSCWVAGKAGLSVELRWVEVNRDGTSSWLFSEATTDTAVLQSGAWQLVTANVAPGPDAVALYPRLYTDEAAPSGAVLSTAWQVAALDAEERPAGLWTGEPPPELAGGWRIGGGAPFVVADPASGGYPRYGFHDAGLVLVET